MTLGGGHRSLRDDYVAEMQTEMVVAEAERESLFDRGSERLSAKNGVARANWVRFFGVFVALMGVFFVVFSPLLAGSFFYPEQNDNAFYAFMAMGFVLIAVGVYLYNWGSKR